MSRGCPYPEHHQLPGKRGGGAGLAFLVVLAVVIAAAYGRQVERAAADVAEVVIVAVLSLVGLAVVVGLAVLGLAIRRRRIARARAAVASAARAELTGRPLAALPRARDDVTAHSRDDVPAHVVTGRIIRPRRGRRWS